MNLLFEEHLREVYGYYENADNALALRRLTDCAIETHDQQIFRETLQYYEWLEKTEGKPEAESRQRALVLLERIRNAGTNIKTAPATSEKILSVVNVGKTYMKSGFKIQNLNFNLSDRQITGLVGENGNGKTTLLRLLAAELKPDTGHVNYHFANTAHGQYDLKTRLIYIEQRIPRWYGTLMDNLRFVLPYYGMKGDGNHLWADMMIARLGLRPYRHLNWKRISSGYRTRFELAKTLLRRPKILLLDEPLANLDIISQQTILQDLKYMAGSISAPFGMILSSQHIYEVEKVSDNIIFIKNGVPQYQQNTTEQTAAGTFNSPVPNEKPVPASLILEMELSCTRDELNTALAQLSVEKIQYNGGVYLLHFNAGTSVSSVMQAMAGHGVEPNYFRNISKSSRRFFIN